MTTVEGEKLHVDGRHSVKVNKAHVVKADVEADNGVIHVIDKVLIPPLKISNSRRPRARGAVAGRARLQSDRPLVQRFDISSALSFRSE